MVEEEEVLMVEEEEEEVEVVVVVVKWKANLYCYYKVGPGSLELFRYLCSTLSVTDFKYLKRKHFPCLPHKCSLDPGLGRLSNSHWAGSRQAGVIWGYPQS